MAKISFPNRACPKCGKAIHIKTRQHDCGWSANGTATSNSDAPTKRKKRRKRRVATVGTATSNASGISIDDIQAVKSVVERLGSDKVLQLAQVLAK